MFISLLNNLIITSKDNEKIMSMNVINKIIIYFLTQFKCLRCLEKAKWAIMRREPYIYQKSFLNQNPRCGILFQS